jgi:ubiquinone/menaquinone biosynthesis C-methylase UbiE
MMPGSEATEHVRRYYEQTANRYDEYVGYFERWFVGDGRAWVGRQASGEVLEIAIGTGRNLPFYPADVRVTGLDLTPAMLAQARERAAALARDVALHVGDAEALPFPVGSFDTVVATLALSSIPNVDRGLGEVRRVLRPGGKLILLEHVRSPVLPVRMIQPVLNPCFVRWFGDQLLREPLEHLVAAGFILEQIERSKGGFIERLVARTPTPPTRQYGERSTR